MARRSGTECVASLDACRILKLTDVVVLTHGRGTTVSRRLDVDCDGPARASERGVVTVREKKYFPKPPQRQTLVRYARRWLGHSSIAMTMR